MFIFASDVFLSVMVNIPSCPTLSISLGMGDSIPTMIPTWQDRKPKQVPSWGRCRNWDSSLRGPGAWTDLASHKALRETNTDAPAFLSSWPGHQGKHPVCVTWAVPQR